MNDDVLNEIDRKLGIIIGLLSQDGMSELNANEKIAYLSRFGVDRETIAFFCEITPKSVGEAVSRLKGKGIL